MPAQRPSLSPRRRLSAALPAFVAGLLLCAPAAAYAGDIIYLNDGKSQPANKAWPPGAGDFQSSNYELIDETMEKVTYRIEGIPTPQEVATSKVRAVAYDPASIPPKLKAGEAALEKGDWDTAADLLGDAAKSDGPPWAKARAAFLAADVAFQSGDFANAEKDLAAFKQAFPKSRLLTAATEHRARALMALGRTEDAKAEFGALRRLPGVSEEVQTEVDYYLAWIDEQIATAKGDAALAGTAMKAYEGLISKLGSKAGMEGLLRRCQVGRAACLITAGKAQEAKDALLKVIGETKDRRALAAAYCRLGSATMRAAPGDKAALKQALLAYLRVIVLYGEEPGTDDDVAEAHYQAGFLFKELKDQGPDWAARARREWSECASKFPGSPWAKRSAQEIGR
jgi:tetratricopeptide (TPR) repeat protein